MALAVGVNSYVTVAEADTYFLDRYGYDLWSPLSNTAKEQALVSACLQMDAMCEWYGYPTDPDQELAFPRDGETTVPDAVKNAQCEIAYMIVVKGSSLSEISVGAAENPLSELKAGSVGLKFDTSKNTNITEAPLVSAYTSALLAPYGDCAMLNAGGRGAKVICVQRA